MRRLPDRAEVRRGHHAARPRLRCQEVAETVAARFGIGMQIDQARCAAGDGKDVVRARGRFQAGGDQFRFDVHHAGHRLVAVVGADDQQHLVAGRSPPLHRGDRHAGVTIRLAQHREMLG